MTDDDGQCEFDSVVSREHLYACVWRQVGLIAETAAAGSITPETFGRLAVDVVMAELKRLGALNPSYAKRRS
jgi:hypothetical protein